MCTVTGLSHQPLTIAADATATALSPTRSSPGSALPDGDRDVVRAVDADELDVRALREAAVHLELRAQPEECLAVGSARTTAWGLPTDTTVSSTCSSPSSTVSISPTSTSPTAIAISPS